MKHTLNRRHFLKTTAVGTAALSIAPGLLRGNQPAIAADSLSRVMLAAHTGLVDASEQVDAKIVRAVLDDTLIALTNTASVRDAWMQIFPALSSTDVIGLKVNCINRRLSSHPEIVYALTDSIVTALDVNPNNLIIWDRTSRELERARYNVNRDTKQVRCLGTSDDIGYDDKAKVDIGGATTVHLSKVLTEMCTYLINVPVLKDHSIAGITLSLKNHYGSIDKPSKGHRNACDPYIANLNNAPHIKDKTKLIVCDAAFGIYRGGPHGSPQWVNRQVLMSTDPVALDTVGMSLIDRQRKENGLSPAAQRATYLQTAASLGLGINQLDRIEQFPLQLG